MKPSKLELRIIDRVETLEAQDAARMDRVARRKNPAAFAELYDRHARLVFSIGCALLKNEEDARDVLQEVFDYVWRTAGRYDAARGSVRAWICWLARGRAVDRLRTRARRLEHEIAPGGGADRCPDPAETLTASDPSPLDWAEERELRGRVRGALDSLPDEQRQVVDLACHQGLSQAEIAKRLNFPLGTIKTRMRLALLKLHDLLAPHVKESP